MKTYYNSPEAEIIKFAALQAIAATGDENTGDSNDDVYYPEETYED